MKIRTTIALLTLALALLGVASAAAETERGRIRPVGAVYSFIADTSHSAKVTVMWEFPDTDIDVVVFDEEGNVTAASFASTDGLEVTEFGIIEGVIYDVVLDKFAGRNSKFVVNVSSAGSELLSGPFGGNNLQYVGNLATLATEDARYAEMKQRLEAAKALKR